MRTIGASAVTLGILAAAAVYSKFGTLSPCGVLRETVRQHDDLAAVLPDSIVDLALTGQYGALSPGRCFAIVMNNLSTPTPNAAQASRPQSVQPALRPAPQPAPVVAQNSMQWAAQVTVQANNEYRAKRLRGELPNTRSVSPMLEFDDVGCISRSPLQVHGLNPIFRGEAA